MEKKNLAYYLLTLQEITLSFYIQTVWNNRKVVWLIWNAMQWLVKFNSQCFLKPTLFPDAILYQFVCCRKSVCIVQVKLSQTQDERRYVPLIAWVCWKAFGGHVQLFKISPPPLKENCEITPGNMLFVCVSVQNFPTILIFWIKKQYQFFFITDIIMINVTEQILWTCRNTILYYAFKKWISDGIVSLVVSIHYDTLWIQCGIHFTWSW